MSEATIEVNGVRLTEGQAMALRVACTDMLGRLTLDSVAMLGDDDHGKRMAAAYHARLVEILRMIASP